MREGEEAGIIIIGEKSNKTGEWKGPRGEKGWDRKRRSWR